MKTRIISVIALLMSAIMMLASCGVPQEKLDEVAEIYTEIGEKYAELVDLCNTNGLLEEDAELAQSLSEYGTAISEYGTQISDELEGMSEDEVDALIADLTDANDQITEILAIYQEALNG